MVVIAIISVPLEAIEVYVVAINVTLGQCDWVILEFMLENIAMSGIYCDSYGILHNSREHICMAI